MSEYASAGPSSPTSFPASWPSVYFNYTVKTLKYGMAACCIAQALNCTPDLDRGILTPCDVKGTFATGVGHGIFSGNASGFQDSSFFIPHICDFIRVWENGNFHLLSYVFSYSPHNLTQFPNLFCILMNILIHKPLSLINPQKRLSRFLYY